MRLNGSRTLIIKYMYANAYCMSCPLRSMCDDVWFHSTGNLFCVPWDTKQLLRCTRLQLLHDVAVNKVRHVRNDFPRLHAKLAI